MKRLALFLLLTIIFFVKTTFSQTQEQQNAPLSFLSKKLIIPPSPEPANLGQYGNVPVSLYTGRINFQVPIYVLKGKEIDLPITLSYNSGGVKVGEAPGWSGLGWALNAGGVISRSALGRPDLCETYYNKGSEIYQNVALLDAIERQDFYLRFHRGFLESEPDAYFYNVNNLTGNFFINTDRSVMLGDYQPIQASIDDVCVNDSEFTIIGPDGTKYLFADQEITDLLYDESSATSAIDHYIYTSAWYLTRMISVNGLDTIHFEYHHDPTTPVVSNDLSAESMSTTIHGPTTSAGEGATPPCGNISGPSIGASAATSINRIFLKSIRLKDVTIDFSSSLSSSWSGGRRLQAITVNDQNQQVQRNELQTSYFGTPTPINTQRLRLDAIKFFGPGNEEISPPYEFQYFDGLPAFNSRSIDHWGYHNGANNSSLLPNFQISPNCPLLGGDANREPSLEDAKDGSLYKIKYPTGGWTECEYELNSRGKAPLLTSQIVEIPHPNSALLIGGNIPSGQTCSGSAKYASVTVRIPTDVTRVSLSIPGLTWNEQQHGEGAKLVAGIIKSSELTYSGCDYFSWIVTNKHKFEYLWFLESNAYPVMTPPTELPAGDYKIIIVNEFASQSVTFGLTYYTETVQQVLNTYPDENVGGLRIAKLKDYASSGIISKIRKFTYESEKTINGTIYKYSSGKSFGDPSYVSTSSYFFEAPCGQDQTSNLIDYTSSTLTISSSSRSVLGTVLGSHVGYSVVKEEEISLTDANRSNGRKITRYRNEGLSGVGFPFTHDVDDFGQGDVLLEEIFDDQNNLIQQSEYEYAFDVNETRNRSVVHGIKVYGAEAQSNRLLLGQTVSNPNEFVWIMMLNQACSTPITANRKIFNSVLKMTAYSIYGHWQYLGKKTTTIYDGENTLTQTEFNTYNPTTNNLEEVRTSDSKGQSTKSTFDYRLATLIERIDQQGIYSEVPHGSQYNVTSAQRVEYETLNGKAFPKYIFRSKSDVEFSKIDLPSKYENVATYYYDEHGDLLKYQKKNDVLQSFLWSKDHLDVLAEAQNTTPDQISFTSFEDGSNEGQWTFNLNASTDSKYGSSSHALNGSSVERSGLVESEKYLLSYWAKNGNPTVSCAVLENYDDEEPSADGWKFYSRVILGPPTSKVIISASSNILIDEVRISPVTAPMTTYTHQLGYGVVCITDPNGQSQAYRYYETGRLKSIQDRYGNTLKLIKYHHKN